MPGSATTNTHLRHEPEPAPTRRPGRAHVGWPFGLGTLCVASLAATPYLGAGYRATPLIFGLLALAVGAVVLGPLRRLVFERTAALIVLSVAGPLAGLPLWSMVNAFSQGGLPRIPGARPSAPPYYDLAVVMVLEVLAGGLIPAVGVVLLRAATQRLFARLAAPAAGVHSTE